MKKDSSVLVLLLWATSFFLSIPFFEPHELFRLAAIVTGFTAFGIALWCGTAQPLKLGGVGLIGVCLLFWMLLGLSLLWTVSLLPSVIALATFSLMPMAFLSLVLLQPSADRLIWIGVAMGLTGGAMGLWVLLQYFIFTDYLFLGAIRYPFADPNNYAGLLNVTLFVALPLLVSSTVSKPWRGLLIFSVVLMVMSITVIGGRGAMGAMVVALLAFLFMARGHTRPCLMIFVLIAVSMALGFTAGQIFEDTRLTSLARLSMLQNIEHVSITSRIDLLRSTVAMIMQHPWLGTGYGTYFLFYPEYRLPSEQGSAGLMAHNDPLQLWAEVGVLAPVLFYAFLVLAMMRMRRYLRQVGIYDTARLLSAGSFCALLTLVLHAHLTFHFYVAALLIGAGLVLGLWYAQTKVADTRMITLPSGPCERGIVIALVLVALLLPVQGLIRSEYRVNHAEAALIAGDMQRFGADVNAANEAGFGQNARAYIQAASVPLALLQDHLNPKPDEEKRALAEQADSLLQKALRVNPRLASIPYHRGMVALAKGDHPAAQAFFEQSLTLAPQYLPARQALITELERSGYGGRAYRLMQEGIAWPYYLHDPRPFLDRTMGVAVQNGDHDTVSKAMAAKTAFEALLKDLGISGALPESQRAAPGDGVGRRRID